MNNYIILSIFLISIHCAVGKVFTRCELAVELKNQGFPVEQLPDWVCLVESESAFDTAVVGGPNVGGSYDWGLYQINDRYWCIPGAIGGDCKIPCESVVTDDITIASTCSKIIYNRHGFTAWNGWKAKCQEELPDLSDCGVY